MKISVFTIDAFTDEPFRGNPAAVCLLEDELEEGWHQKIATEMNLSETAFIRKLHPNDDFTKNNVFLIFKTENTNSSLTFVTLSGELFARQAKDHIILDFPLYVAYPQAAVGNRNVQDVRYSPDTKKFLVRLSDTYERPDLEKLKGWKASANHYDFYSRYFAPWVGVSEDPVTGSAHAVLSSYWSQQLGKKEMCAFQCSSRGGELKIFVRGDGRVDIKGQAVLVLEGSLTI
uniref:Uncharacterized protein n=1 Tax=Sphaerodactylus townsendi TaxID=933632 RepID=A0ACB8F8J2_9SAUR